MLGSLALPAVGQASAAPTDLYVNNNPGANCTDSGSGLQSAPYCTVQAAANVVLPGQTVHVSPGTYPGQLTITRSGTADAPITFLAGKDGTGSPNSSTATIGGSWGQTTVDHALDVSGAQHVVLNGFQLAGNSKEAALVENSSDITLMRGSANYNFGQAVRVTGTSSKVTIGRYSFYNTKGPVVQVDPGVQGTVVTTNQFVNNTVAVSATDAPGTVIVANTVRSECNPGIVLAGASTGATVENNVLDTGDSKTDPTGSCAADANDTGISVSAGSTAGTKVDYNVVSPNSGGPAYNWAGTAYNTQAGFTAASGQGAHDFVADPEIPWQGDRPPVSPVIDSADENAPGMLPVDLNGMPTKDDPVVANTGTGSGYRDRGAEENQNFGSLYTPLAPSRLLDTRNGTGGTSGAVPTGGSVDLKLPDGLKGATAVTLNVTVTDPTSGGFLTVFPHGTDKPTASNLNWTPGTTIANQVTVPVTDGTIRFYVGGGRGNVQIIADLQGYFATHGSVFTPAGPARLLDTRDVGTQLQQGHTLDLPVAGLKGVPANATAVTLNVTATGSTAGGFLTVFPHGTDKPTASNLNWAANQTIANLVTVPVIDGKVSIYAGGGQGSLDVIADVAGYYSADGYNTFRPVNPWRALDTRQDVYFEGEVIRKAGKVPARGTLDVGFGDLPIRNGAVVLNVTVTNPSAPGFLTAYPYGTQRPLASNLNWAAGQTIPNQIVVPVKDGKISLYNGSNGDADFVVDLFGYQGW